MPEGGHRPNGHCHNGLVIVEWAHRAADGGQHGTATRKDAVVNPTYRRTPWASVLVFLALALAATLLTPMPPSAEAQSSPNADCSNLSDPSTDGWTDHEQLGKELRQIERTSQGRVSVEVFGHSRTGLELYAARVGDGDRVILVTSEIHGNEKTGTEALLQMLRTLGSSGSHEARLARENVTLVAVPKYNASGAEVNQRQNVYPWSQVMEDHGLTNTPRAWYYNNNNQGLDLNRDWNPDLTYEVQQGDLPGNTLLPGFFIAPESRHLRDLYLDLRDEFGQVEVYVDLHHMGPCNRVNGALPRLVTVEEGSAMGSYEATGANFGTTPHHKHGISGDIVEVVSSTGVPSEGCGPLMDFPAGSIALVDRGTCNFTVKAANAQAAGASALIVVQNTAANPSNLTGTDDSITIPAMMISRDDGDAIRAGGLPVAGRVDDRLGQYVTVALDYAPLGPPDSDKYDDWPLLDQERSRRYSLAAALGLQEFAGNGNAEMSPFFGGVVRYLHFPERDFPGQVRSAMELNGTNSVLFEVRGQQHAWGQKQKGQLTQVVLHGLWGIVDRMADGSIDDLDGDDFYQLPKYWCCD
jgi:hypothetical protein